ncbi:hypothetical protein PAMP_023935 [Pampus punctatissimus]
MHQWRFSTLDSDRSRYQLDLIKDKCDTVVMKLSPESFIIPAGGSASAAERRSDLNQSAMCLNCTKHKDQKCLLADFLKSDKYDSNFDTSDLEASYASGKQVRVNCHVGFSGFFKLICVGVTWQTRGKPCQPQHCPVIQVADNVQVIGDPETANYGNVIQFSCKSNTEILIGPPEIYCDENGEWNDKGPKCEVPVIENGFVQGSIKEYREHEVLSFTCNRSYKRSQERPSKCTKVGIRAEWSPTPVCELMKCKLELPALAGTSYDPAFRNAFTPGETVRVTCGEKYWISTHRDTSVVSTCQENGQWTIRPICLEITCTSEEIKNADIIGNHNPIYTVGERVTYVCRDVYMKRLTGTCTARGWIHSGYCTATQCVKPHVSNANIIQNEKERYRQGDRVRFACRNDHVTQFTVTCEQGVWTGIQSCGDTVSCPKDPFLHGFVVESDGTLYYTCNDGYKLVTKGWWGEAKYESMCGELPVIPHMNPVKLEDYVNDRNQTIPVVCQKGYHAQVDSLTCFKGKWRSKDIALKKICMPENKPCNPPPKVTNAVVMTSYQKEYLSGSEVTYKCRNKYTMEGGDTITCQEGQWEVTDIKCTLYCNRPKDAQQMMEFIEDKERYMNGDIIYYVCLTSTEKTRGSAKCVDGQWSPPVGCGVFTCFADAHQVFEFDAVERSSGHLRPWEPEVNMRFSSLFRLSFGIAELLAKMRLSLILLFLQLWGNMDVSLSQDAFSCDHPPADGRMTVTGLPDNDNPILPDRFLTFSCDNPGQYLNGSSRLICGKDGKWDNPFPSCEEITCSVDVTHPHLKVVGLLAANKTIQTGHKVQFLCEDEYLLNGSEESECLETGQWSDPFPTCIALDCGRPPFLADGDTKTVARPNYRNNERVEYVCQNYYVMEGNPYKTCINGKWTGEMRCLKPCTVNEELMRTHNIAFRFSPKHKLYSEHNDVIEFMCSNGRRHDGRVALRQYCINEAVGCGRPPPLTNGDVKYIMKSQYSHNERVEYMCQNYFIMDGERHRTCINGEWIGQMRCLKPCTVSNDDLIQYNIAFKYSASNKMYSTHNDVIQFKCTTGRPVGSVGLRQRCDDGVLLLPSCQED